MKKLFGLLTLSVFSFGLLLTSCSKEEVWTDADNFVFNTYDEMRKGPLGGHEMCYKIVFPITVLFEDGTAVEVNDREELITTIRSWKKANPEATERPTIEFPIEVENMDGEIITVESKEELKELISECPFRPKRHRACRHMGNFLNNKCYSVNLPISIVTAEGEIVEVDSRKDLLKLLKAWKKSGSEDVPEIVWPITITLKEDGSKVEVNSMEELEAIIEECRG